MRKKYPMFARFGSKVSINSLRFAIDAAEIKGKLLRYATFERPAVRPSLPCTAAPGNGTGGGDIRWPVFIYCKGMK